jgi:hypothetical protein
MQLTVLRRVRNYVASPGVIWWGLPVAIVSSVWLHVREFGLSLASFARGEFWIRLSIAVVLIGFVGGNQFAHVLRRRGLIFPDSTRRDRDPTT